MLQRRRFYLSADSLSYLDSLALKHNMSCSVLLDTILLNMKNNQGIEHQKGKET